MQKDLAVRMQIMLSSMTAGLLYLSIAPVHKARLAEIGNAWKMKEEGGRWPVRVGHWVEGESNKYEYSHF